MKVKINAMLIPGLKVRKPLPDSSTLREKIVGIVTNEFGIPPSDVFRKCRKREIVMSRQIAMMFIKQYDSHVSLKALGYYFGGRDHTTVIHSIKTIKDLMQSDELLRERVYKIQGMI